MADDDDFGSVRFPSSGMSSKKPGKKKVPKTMEMPAAPKTVSKKAPDSEPEKEGESAPIAGEKANMSAATPLINPPESAVDACKDIELSEPAQPLLKDGQTARELVDALIEQRYYMDAIRVLGVALPRRESVWWACQCVRSATPEPSDKTKAALEAAEKWIVKPIESHRRSAREVAEEVGLDQPAATVAMAAFLSGGSMAPPDLPPVVPAGDLSGKAVAGAILLSAVQDQPEKAPEKHGKYLALGLQIAEGKNKWKE